MSSTERAPEPTMEEILASIRRIISDDEASTAQQRATSAEYAEQVRAEDADDSAADTQMIDDIARVLSGGAKAASSDDDIDDILDLTEPGGSASEAMAELPAEEPISVLEEVVLETEIYTETGPKLDFAAAFPPQDQSLPEAPPNYDEAPPSYAEEDRPGYSEPAPSYAEEARPNYFEPIPSYTEEPAVVVELPTSEPVTAAQPAPPLDDPTTALERAIAALKAGDLAAFAREAQSEYVAPEPAYVAPEPAPEVPAAEPYIEPEPPSFEPGPTTVVLEEETVFLGEPEREPSVPTWSAETPSWSQTESTPEPKPEPKPETVPWRSESRSWRGSTPANEFELNPARVNGGSDREPHDFAAPVSSKSLEDSVKEMLRPLLKQWLDENMPRVLTKALREELENSDMQRRGS
jgi:cell pole-organizing protein PopZ